MFTTTNECSDVPRFIAPIGAKRQVGASIDNDRQICSVHEELLIWPGLFNTVAMDGLKSRKARYLDHNAPHSLHRSTSAVKWQWPLSATPRPTRHSRTP
jgi:hypothetical protein